MVAGGVEARADARELHRRPQEGLVQALAVRGVVVRAAVRVGVAHGAEVAALVDELGRLDRSVLARTPRRGRSPGRSRRRRPRGARRARSPRPSRRCRRARPRSGRGAPAAATASKSELSMTPRTVRMRISSGFCSTSALKPGIRVARDLQGLALVQAPLEAVERAVLVLEVQRLPGPQRIERLAHAAAGCAARRGRRD